MTVNQAITIASALFGDPNNTHLAATTWATLMSKAEREIARFSHCLASRVTCDDLTAGTYLYTLATGGIFGTYDILQVVRFMIGYAELRPIQEWQMLGTGRSHRDNSDASAWTEPEYFYTTPHDYLGLYPAPSASYITPIYADIVHLPVADLAVDGAIAIHPMFHDDLAMYTAYLGCIADKEAKRAEHLFGLLRESLVENTRRFTKERNYRVDTPVADFEVFNDDV